MFGLSFAEMAIVMVMALIVIGPKELPTVIRAILRTVGQLRELGTEFRKNFDELAEEAKLKDLHDELQNDLTRMPTIIDMEGNEQRTYDIADDLAHDAKRRHPATEPKVEPEAEALKEQG
jgi:sec-independent protein translocase protein TatB